MVWVNIGCLHRIVTLNHVPILLNIFNSNIFEFFIFFSKTSLFCYNRCFINGILFWILSSNFLEYLNWLLFIYVSWLLDLINILYFDKRYLVFEWIIVIFEFLSFECIYRRHFNWKVFWIILLFFLQIPLLR